MVVNEKQEFGHIRMRARSVCPAPENETLDLEVRAGEIIVLVGGPESNRVRWLTVLAGLRPAAGGDVRFFSDGSTRERAIAYISADEPLLSTFTVRANVMLPRLYHCQEHPDTASKLADEALDGVGFAGDRESLPASLDREETRQVQLARALATDPAMLFLHEPFDFQLAEHWPVITEQLVALARQQNRSVVVATQNLRFAQEHADRITFVDSTHVAAFDDWDSFASAARGYVKSTPLALRGQVA